MHWLWLRVHRLVILQARWQILSWFWTACNFCSLDRTTTKMMSNRQPMRIRREQRGFALPAIPAGKHSFIGLLKIIFFLGFEYKLMVIFFSFCRDRRTCGNTKWCRPQPVFSSDRHWGRDNTSFPNTGKWAIASLTHHKFSECPITIQNWGKNRSRISPSKSTLRTLIYDIAFSLNFSKEMPKMLWLWLMKTFIHGLRIDTMALRTCFIFEYTFSL